LKGRGLSVFVVERAELSALAGLADHADASDVD
jgi:hypothetical protein